MAESSSQSEAPAATPVEEPRKAPAAPRMYWRVVVSTGKDQEKGRIAQRMSWHLQSCADPSSSGAHCEEGQRLMAIGESPDGHCLLDGICPRCSQEPA